MSRTKKPGVADSPAIKEIIAYYDDNYKTSSVPDMAHYILTNIDSNYSKRQMTDFLYKFARKRKDKVNALIEAHVEAHALDDALNDVQYFARVKQKAHEMGNAIMESTAAEIMSYIDQGQPIPDSKKNMVMGWMFRFKDAEQRDRQIEIAAKSGANQERLVDGLLNTLIYSRDLKPEDVIEAEYEDLGHPKAIEIATQHAEGVS